MSALHIEPLDATLGAIVTGVDLAALDEPSWGAVQAAFLEHALLIFPRQHLDAEAQVAIPELNAGIPRPVGGDRCVFTGAQE